jgi:hypothetical protein
MAYFVGDPVATHMLEMKVEAAEWLADVKEAKTEAAPANGSEPHYEPMGADSEFGDF